MKARIPPQYTSEQRKALLAEIRAQCIEETARYEVLIDAVIFNAFARVIGYDKELLRSVYNEVAAQRARAKEEYRKDGLQADFASFFELQMHGIDMMKWSEDTAKRLEV